MHESSIKQAFAAGVVEDEVAIKRGLYKWHRSTAKEFAQVQARESFRRDVMYRVGAELSDRHKDKALLSPSAGKSLGAAVMECYATAYIGEAAKEASLRTTRTDIIQRFSDLRDYVYWGEDGQRYGDLTPEDIAIDMGRKWKRNAELGVSVATLIMAGAVNYAEKNNMVYCREGRMLDVLRHSLELPEAFASMHDDVENKTLDAITGGAKRINGCYVADAFDGRISIPPEYYTTVGAYNQESIVFQDLPHFDPPPDSPTLGCPLRIRDHTRSGGSELAGRYGRLSRTVLTSNWTLTAEVYMLARTHGGLVSM